MEYEDYTVVTLTLSIMTERCGYTFEHIERKPNEIDGVMGKISVKFESNIINATATVRPYNIKGVSVELKDSIINYLADIQSKFIHNLTLI